MHSFDLCFYLDCIIHISFLYKEMSSIHVFPAMILIFICTVAFSQEKSMKTTSMETVSTGVLDENREHYLRSND